MTRDAVMKKTYYTFVTQPHTVMVCRDQRVNSGMLRG